jgi:hypothetical protein
MRSLRTFFRDHRTLALGLVLLALCMKVLVPGGFMIGSQVKLLTIEICGDASGTHLTKQISVPMDGKSGHDQSEQGKADSACPYSALSIASLAGADMLLLATALAFIMALGFLPIAARLHARTSYLRPPLRGPPALT